MKFGFCKIRIHTIKGVVMKKLFLIIVCTAFTGAMESPAPANRFFLRDLMKTYQDKNPLDLAQKSQATITDIKNWIAYARNDQKSLAEFAREFSSSPEEIEFVLDILDAEIQNNVQAHLAQTPVSVTKPVQLKPITKPAPAKPVVLKPTAKPVAASTSAITPTSTTSFLVEALIKSNVIKNRVGNFIQVKTVDQFRLGHGISPATCPIQALRNVIILLRFANTGLQTILSLLQDTSDARAFLDKVEQCNMGTQWLTAEELGRILNKMGDSLDLVRNQISAVDTVQEFSLYPDKLKALQDQFKQQKAVHGFIIGTMDVGQFTGKRGHYFALVLYKSGSEYLYLIADTAPAQNHLDPDSYDFKRIKYITDMITQGKSEININAQVHKITDVQYEEVMGRALAKGAQFDFKSLSKNDLEGFERITLEVEHNKNEWKNKTQLDDKQLADALVVVKQKVQEQLKQFKKR